MSITFEKSFCTPAAIDKAWKFVSDPMQVVRCIPGAKITGQVDAHTFAGLIQMKMGASTATYAGTVKVLRVDENTHEVEIMGKGKDTTGRGSASLKMTGRVRPLATGGSEVTGTLEMNVLGLLAQIGSRLFSDVSSYMFNEFTSSVQGRLKSELAADAAEVKTAG
ncbi:MAG TPA: SRPBCC family protein [Candidatus Saccharimonadales bacterium]|jgi:carbon monoxide dehydrogenase subunit G|nr:SRPBCC family protein [Candidatus Saccharimonadales bacterium]